MEDTDITCGGCSEFVVAQDGSSHRDKTRLYGHCTAPRPEWCVAVSPLIAGDNPMAEICPCYRKKVFGS